MVKLALIFLTSPFLLIAGEFSASVNTAQVPLNDTFSLNLTLKGTYPKDAPEVAVLNKHFIIHSEQHSNNTTVINGKVTTSITWKISLTPKTDGVLEIPPITIHTAEGPLSTQAIALNVTKVAALDSDELNVIAEVSNPSPYKNEPFVYTALLTSKMPLYNIQSEKLELKDAIVELLEQPKLEERAIGGVLHNVVEFSYLITPLKGGPLTIPPIGIQVGIAKQKNDPFSFMQGFGRLQSINLKTEEIPLDVLPVVTEVSPWLPAKALTLEEQWSSDQSFRVGEPLSRGFLIKGEGIKASQLPHLDLSHGSFKVYADKPEEQEKVLQNTLHSQRKEHYTLIPQVAGSLELPEISINWWDSAEKEKRTSTLPSRTLQIQPALETEEIAYAPQPQAAASETPVSPPSPHYFLYAIIGILTFFLTAALLWGFTLQRKIASLTKKPPQTIKSPPVPAVKKEKKEKLPDLNPT